MIVELTIRLVSESNRRDGFRRRAKRSGDARGLIRLKLESVYGVGAAPTGPLVVTVTRRGPKAMDAHDNLRAACKALVDGVADYLGRDDASASVTWEYAQEKGAHGVRVEIRRNRREPCAACCGRGWTSGDLSR